MTNVTCRTDLRADTRRIVERRVSSAPDSLSSPSSSLMRQRRQRCQPAAAAAFPQTLCARALAGHFVRDPRLHCSTRRQTHGVCAQLRQAWGKELNGWQAQHRGAADPCNSAYTGDTQGLQIAGTIVIAIISNITITNTWPLRNRIPTLLRRVLRAQTGPAPAPHRTRDRAKGAVCKR